MLYPKLSHQQPVGGAIFPIFVLMHASLPSSKPSKTVTSAPQPRVSVATPQHGRIAQTVNNIMRLNRQAFLLAMAAALAAGADGSAAEATEIQFCHAFTGPVGEILAEQVEEYG